MPKPGKAESQFWGYVVVRTTAIMVAGLALIVFFREVMIPALKGDVERIQKEHLLVDQPKNEANGK